MTAPTIEAPVTVEDTATPASEFTLTPQGMQDALARVAAIPDDRYIERIKAATRLNQETVRLDKIAQSVRDNAAMSAKIDFGIAPVRVYTDALKCSRSLYSRMCQRANRKSPLKAIVKHTGRKIKAGDKAAILDVAAEYAEAVRVYDEVGKAARSIRDETGRAAMEGEYGVPLSNADFARMCEFSTARASQIRK